MRGNIKTLRAYEALAKTPFRPKCAGGQNKKKTFSKNFITFSNNHLPQIIHIANSPFRPQRAGLPVIQRDIVSLKGSSGILPESIPLKIKNRRSHNGKAQNRPDRQDGRIEVGESTETLVSSIRTAQNR
jgi:hypothetical protein